MSCVKIFEVVCIFFQKKKPNPPTDEKKKATDPEGWFDLSVKELLDNPNRFLESLIKYDKDNIPEAVIQKVKPLMELDVLTEKAIANASKALVPVRVWA